MFAAGVTNYDGEDFQIEDPQIATLKMYMKVWNASDPDVSFGFHEIPSRFCTKGELNIDGKNETSDFYPHSEVTRKDVETYAARLKCFEDPSKVNIAGNFDSQAAYNMMVVLEKCDNKTSNNSCKSPEAIDDWLTWKYILLVQN